MDKEQTYAGVDVSKDYLDVTIVDSDKTWRFANNQVGIKKVIKIFQEMASIMVVFESTGGLEISLWLALNQAGINAALSTEQITGAIVGGASAGVIDAGGNALCR